MTEAILVLEDGEVFNGESFGTGGDCFGEVVFNTSMTGYQEILTDPSYAGQIVVMTYPHIGNYGTNPEDPESSKPAVAGFVIRDLPVEWSNWRGDKALQTYLEESGIPAIKEIDTRRLTRHIRSKGAMRGAFSSEADANALLSAVLDSPGMIGRDLVSEVSHREAFDWPCEEPVARVAAYDFGIKLNILRLFQAHGVEVRVFPASTPAEEILEWRPDGVFLSNGPGDPEAVSYGISATRSLIGKVPIFGICLGHQLLGIATGLKTYKLPFGHRGANHPVARLSDQAIEITTQNHGFAVAHEAFGFEPPAKPGAPLPSEAYAESDFGPMKLTHLNLNDYTVEGFRLESEPAFGVQYHPEAGPGPHDSRYLFSEFLQLMEVPESLHRSPSIAP